MIKIYFDNAATTKIDDKVVEIINQAMINNYGNPSSIHSFGSQARKLVEEAREKVAILLNAKPIEIVFTSGATESNNLAIKGVADAAIKKGKHIITSAIEHHAVLHTVDYLVKHGWEASILPVNEYGLINPEEVAQTIRTDTVLVSIMFANNEVGTIQPIKEIGAICRKKNVYFHTDAVQAVTNIPVDVEKMNIDLLSLSGHKIHSVKGCGALYIKKGVKIFPIQHGGSHERNLRAGTENVPGISGLGKAVEIGLIELQDKKKHLEKLRNKMIRGIFDKINYVKLNGHPEKRLPGNVNFSFKFIEGESLLLNLDLQGIAATSGSACTSGSLDPSHVLLAMGLDHETAHGSLRLSFSKFNTEKEVNEFLKIVPGIVGKLRKMSPLYKNNK